MLAIEVPLIEVGRHFAHGFKGFIELGATLDDMLRENILLAVDPKVIESFLRTVDNFRQVSGPRAVLLEHLLVQHLVRVGEVFPIGLRARFEAHDAHEALQAAQVRLADL